MSKKTEKTRYTDSELEEFKAIIDKKLANARKDLEFYQAQIRKKDEEGEGNIDFKFNGLEDSNESQEKEYLSQMASRQIKFISHLESALTRIANRTYGICKETGKLISAERLRAVPHATLSIDAKKSQKKS